MEWRTSKQSGWPPSMGDTLRLTGDGSATSLHSSAPALLHALRTRQSMDAAPYLNQARATYPGGMSELDAALHLLHPPDEDLEVGKVTLFVEGASETPTRPPPTNPVYDGAKPTPPIPRCEQNVPQRGHLVPRAPVGHPRAPRLGPPAPLHPPLQDGGCPPQRAGPMARAPWHPPAPPRHHEPRRLGAGPGGHLHPPLRGGACAPPPLPAPEARDGVHAFLRTQEVTAVTGVHLVRLPPATPDDPRELGALSPILDWGLWRGKWAEWLARLPPKCRWMATGH